MANSEDPAGPDSGADTHEATDPDPGADAPEGDRRDDEGWDSDPDGRSAGDGDDPDTVTVGDRDVVRAPLTPEEIDPENALFVVLGALAMVFVAYQIWSLL